MKTVNALSLRNNLGAVLDEIEQTKEPILVSKGRKLRAALISIEDFQKRFIDKQAEEEREIWLRKLQGLLAPRSAAFPASTACVSSGAIVHEVCDRRIRRAPMVPRRGEK